MPIERSREDDLNNWQDSAEVLFSGQAINVTDSLNNWSDTGNSDQLVQADSLNNWTDGGSAPGTLPLLENPGVVIVLSEVGDLFNSQIVLDVLGEYPVDLRHSQIIVEVLKDSEGALRNSQIVLEVLWKPNKGWKVFEV